MADLLHWIATRDPAPGSYYVVSQGWQTLVGSEDRFWIRLPTRRRPGSPAWRWRCR